MNYRSDIDGLRAIAVIAVVLFHAHLPLSGGFVGVDVFFVISGFLITGIILREVKEGRFSLKDFWLRRIRRILPAATVVTLVTLAVGSFIVPQESLKTLGETAIAQALMLSNVAFWKMSAGYFSENSELNALLHTWSLSVEEQFYIFFPLVLVFLLRKTKRAFSVLLFIAIGSLCVSAYLLDKDPSASFYLLPSRAWEMLMGALAALMAQRLRPNKLLREGMAWVGLAAIILPMFLYDKNTVFPGLFALPPVLGTVLLLLCYNEKQTFVSKALSWEPLVWVGLASYSIYLWHWPILVFIKHMQIEITGLGIAIALVLTAFFSYISWRFVEQPFRRAKFLKVPFKAFTFGALTSLTVATLGIVMAFTKVFPMFMDNERTSLERDITWTGKEYRDKSGDGIVLGNLDGVSEGDDYILWGDSHAMVLAEVVDNLSKELNMKGVAYLSSGMPPVTNLWKPLQGRAKQKETVELNESRCQSIVDSGCKNVVLAARWQGMVDGLLSTEMSAKPKEFPMVVDNEHDYPSQEVSSRALLRQLDEMVKTLANHNINVWFVLQVPSSSRSNVARDFYALKRFPFVNRKEFRFDTVEREYRSDRKSILKLVEEIESENFFVIDPVEHFYGVENRLLLYGESAYFRDEDHLSRSGAEFYMEPVLRGLLERFSSNK